MGRMHTCRKCRALLEPDVKVCPYCGTRQRWGPLQSESAEAASTARIASWIIAANLVIYLLAAALDPEREAGGLSGPSGAALRTFGLSDVLLVEGCGQYWRLFTAIFLHIDLLHLAMNTIALFVVVPLAAASLGPHRTLVVYLAGGVAASAASHLAGNTGAGASGAICAAIGALAVYGRRRRDDHLFRRMMFWLLIIAVYGAFARGIDNVAHGAGAAAGAALGWPAAAVRVRGGRADLAWQIGAYAWLAAAAAAFAVFLLPNVVRSFDRREVQVYQSRTARALRAIEAHLSGAGALPDAPGGAPEGAGDLSRALLAALEAARGGDRARAARALEEAVAAWRAWSERAVCAYAVWPETQP